MPNPVENELGLGPVMHRLRRWSRNKLARLGNGTIPEDKRMLDPLTVNYEAWHEVRRTVREWPQYKEAANSIEILVSPEDWDDYWGIDTSRKEAGVSAYVRARAKEKNYWMAGDPQISVYCEDDIEPGEVEVICRFAEPQEEGVPAGDFSSTAAHEPLVQEHGLEREPHGQASEIVDEAYGEKAPKTERHEERRVVPTTSFASQFSQDEDSKVEDFDEMDGPSAVKFVDASKAGQACLADAHGFRLVLGSGDCIGAVSYGQEVSPEVNVRLDADRFPYVGPKQCSLGVIDGRWMVVNHAKHGTQLVLADGRRLMLGSSDPYPISEGDVLFLGPQRPLRFELL